LSRQADCFQRQTDIDPVPLKKFDQCGQGGWKRGRVEIL
jgi:hypothetical protein